MIPNKRINFEFLSLWIHLLSFLAAAPFYANWHVLKNSNISIGRYQFRLHKKRGLLP